jgi:hypothetical protein
MRDPIVDQIHKYRLARAAKFNHDIDAMFADLRRMEEESRAQGAKFVTPPKRRKSGFGPGDFKTPKKGEEPREVPSGDPIVAEVRRIRERNAARFGYDVGRIVEDAVKRQANSGHRVVDFSDETSLARRREAIRVARLRKAAREKIAGRRLRRSATVAKTSS